MSAQRMKGGTGFTHEAPNDGETVEWYTPPFIFEKLGLEFDLDPCSPGAGVVPWIPARRHISLPDDGLTAMWDGRVWLNPPYGRETAMWLDRLGMHGHGIALVFARTDTRWFHRAAAMATVVGFLTSRVAFVAADGRPPRKPAAGSMFLAYGRDCAKAVYNSGLCTTMALAAPREETEK